MPIIDHFGLLAPIYEKFIPPPENVQFEELLEIEDGLSLLDVGGGTGRVSSILRESFRQVTIADLSHDMLSQAVYKNLDAVQAHSEHLPFPIGYFDRIIIVDALHHVCDQAQTAAEMFRLLAPGGLMIIEEPNFERFTVKILAAMERIALMRSRFLTPDQIAELFRYPNQEIVIHRDGHTSWIVVRKLA